MLTDRGYTMHEHLPEFNLINMNGRVYDPLLAMFLSPDPQLQAPDNWLNYNRYSYCLNNPFKYTDPSGELFGIDDMIIIAIMMGAAMNVNMQMMAGNINSGGDFWKAAGIGALAGLAGYGAGALVAGSLKVGGFAGGALIGGSTGFSSGFTAGFGNALVDGKNFGQSLGQGGIYGAIGMGSGALIGGLTRGFSDYGNGYSFWDGSRVHEFTLGTSSTDKTLAKTFADRYNDNSFNLLETNDQRLHDLTLREFNIQQGSGGLSTLTTKVPEYYGLTGSGTYLNLKTGELVGGWTHDYSSGFSDIHIAESFVNGDIVSFKAVVGHELIHAYHNYHLLPHMTSSPYNKNPLYDIYTERVAYQYTVNVYANNGKFLDAWSSYTTARSLNFWGSYPAQFRIPYFFKYY